MRLTKVVIQQILDQNEGFTDRTSFQSKNSSYTNYYRISNGQLYIRSVGKTSWSDSRFDDEGVCDLDQTRRFIRNNLYVLNTGGIE